MGCIDMSSNQVREYLDEKAKAVLEFHKSQHKNPESAFISNIRHVTLSGSSTQRLEFKVTIVSEGKCMVCEDSVLYTPYDVTTAVS